MSKPRAWAQKAEMKRTPIDVFTRLDFSRVEFPALQYTYEPRAPEPARVEVKEIQP